jgi:hypothetical protein
MRYSALLAAFALSAAKVEATLKAHGPHALEMTSSQF